MKSITATETGKFAKLSTISKTENMGKDILGMKGNGVAHDFARLRYTLDELRREAFEKENDGDESFIDLMDKALYVSCFIARHEKKAEELAKEEGITITDHDEMEGYGVSESWEPGKYTATLYYYDYKAAGWYPYDFEEFDSEEEALMSAREQMKMNNQ